MNRVMLMGRLTRDPEIRMTQDEMKVARFTLAVDRRGAKEGQQSADFIGCVAFDKRADVYDRYLHQGSKVLIEGHIQTGSYTDKDGRKVYTTVVVVDGTEFAESKKAETAQRETQETQEGFMQIPEGVEDEGLPFN